MPIYLSSAPSRLSLFGGGTDLPSYAENYVGLVISISISLYQRHTLYLGNSTFDIDSNSYPAGADPNFYYTIMNEFGLNGHHHFKLESKYDGLIESGMGSSAAAAVALVGAVNVHKALGMTPKAIAIKAWEIENDRLGMFSGMQDVAASATGGVNVFEFSEGTFYTTPLMKGFIEPLLPSLLLFYTGIRREKKDVQEGLRTLDLSQVEFLHKIKKLAYDAVDPIASGDIEKVGSLLKDSWELKKATNNVTNPKIDQLIDLANRSGSFGTKLNGSGQGGFLLCVADPARKEELIEAMEDAGCENYNFSVDWNGLQVRREPEYI